MAGGTAEVTVILPAALVRLFAGAPARLELAAATLGEVIDELDRRWPGMRDRLCDSTPRIRRHINVFMDGRRIGLGAGLRPGAVVTVMTGVIG